MVTVDHLFLLFAANVFCFVVLCVCNVVVWVLLRKSRAALKKIDGILQATEKLPLEQKQALFMGGAEFERERWMTWLATTNYRGPAPEPMVGETKH